MFRTSTPKEFAAYLAGRLAVESSATQILTQILTYQCSSTKELSEWFAGVADELTYQRILWECAS